MEKLPETCISSQSLISHPLFPFTSYQSLAPSSTDWYGSHTTSWPLYFQGSHSALLLPKLPETLKEVTTPLIFRKFMTPHKSASFFFAGYSFLAKFLRLECLSIQSFFSPFSSWSISFTLMTWNTMYMLMTQTGVIRTVKLQIIRNQILSLILKEGYWLT
jgi:hypothetical protein